MAKINYFRYSNKNNDWAIRSQATDTVEGSETRFLIVLIQVNREAGGYYFL